MKLHKFLLITCAIMLIIPFVSAGLFGPDIPNDAPVWQPIDKFKQFEFSSYANWANKMKCFVVYKNQYDEYECKEVSIREYYHINITEKCRC